MFFCEGGCKKWFHVWYDALEDLHYYYDAENNFLQVHGVRTLSLYLVLILTPGRYHSVSDPRAPTQFICFDCRARADVSWDLINLDIYPQMLMKFKDLTLFRLSFSLQIQRVAHNVIGVRSKLQKR